MFTAKEVLPLQALKTRCKMGVIRNINKKSSLKFLKASVKQKVLSETKVH